MAAATCRKTLVPALDRLEAVSIAALDDPEFVAELDAQLSDWVGRPTAPYLCAGTLCPLGRRQGVSEA
jgi:tryptophan synthase beta subunit